MKTTELRFKARDYRGDVTPPVSTLEDESRWKHNGTFGAGAAEPSWTKLPTGLWVLNYDGGDDVDLGDLDIGGLAALIFIVWIRTTQSGGVNATAFMGGGQNTARQIGFAMNNGAGDRLQVTMEREDNVASTTVSSTRVINDGIWHLCGCRTQNSVLSSLVDEDAPNDIASFIATISLMDDTRLGEFPYLARNCTADINGARVLTREFADNEFYSIFQAERSLYGR